MAARIAIAVCTMRRAGEAAECLAALAREAGGTDVAVIANALDEAALAEHRRAFDGEVVAEPRPGLSRARNRAVAWAESRGAEVIAFVDDDAVVGAGWREALQRAWNAAPPEVACIGGPIRPRYTIPPPAWFSDGIAHTLTLLDRGQATRDLDPDDEAVYGANISFRIPALGRIGGFDPALGHAGRRVFFSEEDEAQRALVRLGYRIRYVPDAAVEHVIPAGRLTRRSFLRRRFAYGAALGRRGGRGRAAALRQALASGAGALVASAAGRPAVAMERAVRAAENAGVVAAALVARRRG